MRTSQHDMARSSRIRLCALSTNPAHKHGQRQVVFLPAVVPSSVSNRIPGWSQPRYQHRGRHGGWRMRKACCGRTANLARRMVDVVWRSRLHILVVGATDNAGRWSSQEPDALSCSSGTRNGAARISHPIDPSHCHTGDRPVQRRFVLSQSEFMPKLAAPLFASTVAASRDSCRWRTAPWNNATTRAVTVECGPPQLRWKEQERPGCRRN